MLIHFIDDNIRLVLLDVGGIQVILPEIGDLAEMIAEELNPVQRKRFLKNDHAAFGPGVGGESGIVDTFRRGAFDCLHFYGNRNTIAWSPGWYRSEVRVIRNTIPAWSSEAQMNLKSASVQKFWDDSPPRVADFSKIDAEALHMFTGTHPWNIRDWLSPAEGIFRANPNHQLSVREKKRLMLKQEQWLGFQFSKRHYKLIY